MWIVITRSASGSEDSVHELNEMVADDDEFLCLVCSVVSSWTLAPIYIFIKNNEIHYFYQHYSLANIWDLHWIICCILERSIALTLELFNNILDLCDDLIYTRCDAVEVQIVASSSPSSSNSSIISVSCTKRLISAPQLPASS